MNQEILAAIEAERKHSDRGWQYSVGDFALGYFLAGYVLETIGIVAAYRILIVTCELYHYPAIALLYDIIMSCYSDNDNACAKYIAGLENFVRENGYIHWSKELSIIAKEYDNGGLNVWYMACGIVLAQAPPLNLNKFALLINTDTYKVPDIELLTMLYSFIYSINEMGEADIVLKYTLNDIISFAEQILPSPFTS